MLPEHELKEIHDDTKKLSEVLKETIMGRAIDLFVTYRFIKLLVTPFEKQEAYKLGIIDKEW